MSQILTVTLNPALDLATNAPCVTPGIKLRCGTPTAEPGGGGVNVARAIRQLGGRANALVALGGPNGLALGNLLDQLDMPILKVEAPGETRHSFAVTDDKTGAQYRFVLSGPEWTPDQLGTVLGHIEAYTKPGALVVLSGSLPLGAPVDFLSTACARLADRRVIIDTSGAHLSHVAKGTDPMPKVLRMDSYEAMTLSRKPLTTRDECVAYAEFLCRAGAAELVIIARGKDGSVLAGPTGHWHADAVNDTVVSAIGAGDSFVGGFTMGLASGADPQDALRVGAAAASAACLSPGTQLCHLEDFDALLPKTTLTRI